MDFLLPVAQPLGVFETLRHWRDIAQSDPVEMTAGGEPLTIDDAKTHLRIDADLPDEDPWLTVAISAVRRTVESDLNRCLSATPTTYEMSFDQFPIERIIPVPRPPFLVVTTFTWFDLLTSVESAVDPTTYFLDTTSQPGRIILVPGKVWPTSVRWQQGGRLRWTAGYTSAAAVPARWVHAMKLLLGHWYEHREAVTSGTARYTPDQYPLGYEALLGDRLTYLG